MLNEERVKLMTKLAFYETKGGSEELKISFRLKKNYINFHVFWAWLWLTISYTTLIVLTGAIFLKRTIQLLTTTQKTAVIISVIGLYLILVVTYITRVKHIHKRKHARAYHRVKKFKEELGTLEEMYEKEERNEDTI